MKIDNFKILESLICLNNIQNEFKGYQKQCFKQKPPEFFCLELNGEAGELANLEKKIWKGKSIPKELIEDESADVFISLINYCNEREIDLSKVVVNKLLKIEQKRISLLNLGEDY